MKELIIMLLKIVVFIVLPTMAVVFLGAALITIFINNVILQLVLAIIFATILAFALMLYMYWFIEIKNIF